MKETLQEIPRIIQLPKITDPRGNLSIIEEDTHIPFKIRQVYWIYDIKGGEQNGGNAFRETEEFIVALSGSFDVIIIDEFTMHKYSFNRPYYGIYLPKLTWRYFDNFSTNSLGLIIKSMDYSKSDNIQKFSEFISLKNEWGKNQNKSL